MSIVLSGGLHDPMLQNLEVVAVKSNEEGQFLFVSIRQINVDQVVNKDQVINKLHAIQGYLRSAIAKSIERKRVPALKFYLLQGQSEVNSYA